MVSARRVRLRNFVFFWYDFKERFIINLARRCWRRYLPSKAACKDPFWFSVRLAANNRARPVSPYSWAAAEKRSGIYTYYIHDFKWTHESINWHFSFALAYSHIHIILQWLTCSVDRRLFVTFVEDFIQILTSHVWKLFIISSRSDEGKKTQPLTL